MTKFFSSKNNDFALDALLAHNECRKDHGVPPLTLNKDISKLSQKWADELAKKDAMAYNHDTKYGENVFCGWSADPNAKVTAQDCIDKWYSEINDYSFGREPEILKCGHFTQIVWRDTKELGIGVAKSKSGKTYVVANYNPPGNYTGLFVKNVPPPGANQFRAGDKPLPAKNGRSASAPVSKMPQQHVPSPKPDTKSEKLGTFEEECLAAHNEYRRKHGVPPLTLSKKLCKYAEEWAKSLAKQDKMHHRDQHEYGENIFYAWSSDPSFSVSGRTPVEKWYSEIKDFTFGKEPTNHGTGHFTQVVWEDTKEVGVGMAKSKDGKYYVVANYHPHGNVIGRFSAKVHPPK